MKRFKSVISLLLVIVLSLSFSINVAAQAQLSTEETVTRLHEIETLRGTDSETYLLSNGSYECVVYAEEKYYLDDSKTLQPIDNSIKRADTATFTTSGQYKNTANAFDVYFSDSGTPKVDIVYNESGISFTPVTVTSGKTISATRDTCDMAVGKVENCATLNDLTATGDNTVIYNNAFPDTDLVYVLNNRALKEYIILNSKNASNEFRFMFTLDNVTMQTDDNSAYFTAADGSTVFALDALFAVDANGVVTEDLSYSFAPVANSNKVAITVTMDEEYLASSDRAYPVVIDPTIMISSSETADACVCSNTEYTNYQMSAQLRTGYEPDYGTRRSYIKFNIPSSIPVGTVTNATLDIEKVSGVAPTIKAYLCMSSWSSSTITWDNQPSGGYNFIYGSSVSVPFRPGSSWYTMDVTDIVSKWVNDTYENYGFILRDVTENDPDHWTTLYSSDADSPHKPELHITYNPYLFTHYFDNSFNESRQSQIDNAVSFTNDVYQLHFGLEFGTKGTPEARSGLTSGTHKDIISISNTLNSDSRDANERIVFWTDYSTGTYCSHESGTCQPFDALACVYQHRPIIHITDLLSANGTSSHYKACMSLLLAHETAHTFGLDERYYLSSHSVLSMNCIMAPYDQNSAYDFYIAIQEGDAYGFCSNCKSDLYELIFA